MKIDNKKIFGAGIALILLMTIMPSVISDDAKQQNEIRTVEQAAYIHNSIVSHAVSSYENQDKLYANLKEVVEWSMEEYFPDTSFNIEDILEFIPEIKYFKELTNEKLLVDLIKTINNCESKKVISSTFKDMLLDLISKHDKQGQSKDVTSTLEQLVIYNNKFGSETERAIIGVYLGSFSSNTEKGVNWLDTAGAIVGGAATGGNWLGCIIGGALFSSLEGYQNTETLSGYSNHPVE